MTGKIVKIADDKVLIGMEDGGLREARREDCDFTPEIGDVVELFQSDSMMMVHKIVPEKKEQAEAKDAAKDYEAKPVAAPSVNINISDIGKVESPVVRQPVTSASYPDTRSVVNKVAYCVLAFFLGSLGVQKFFAGKTGSGILCILFCWTGIPTLIGIIDCLSGLFKKADSNGNIVV